MTSISPTTIAAGSADVTLTVNGTGFQSSTIIQVGGKAESTTFVSATQVTAKVTAAQLVSGGNLGVVAVNGSQTSGSGAVISFEVDNPAPAISNVSPTVLITGTTSLAVTVTGTGFVPTTVINVNGSARTTTFTNSTQVVVVLTAADVTAPADLSLTAVNSTPGGGTSVAEKVTVAAPNPVPTISGLNPGTTTVGAASPVIAVTGTGFISSTVINVNGSPRATTFVTATQVNVVLQAADLPAPGTLALTAVNPAPGGGTSASASLSVVNPVPSISSLNPATVSIVVAPPTVAVNGAGFVSTTVVNVNGSPRNTSFVSSTVVNVTLTAADVSALGSLSLTAVNGAPGGGTSAAVILPVNNPPVGTLRLSPSALVVGGTSPATITVTGNTFLPASTLQFNGAQRTVTYVNSTTLTFVTTVAEQAALGTFPITVTNPAPGGGTSPMAVLTIGTPSPTPIISSISPNPIYTGSPDTQITINGTGLTQDSTVQWNGTDLLVTGYGYAYYGMFLTATVPAADLAKAGTATVTVNTPTARPSLSNSVIVTISDPPAPTLTSISPASGPMHAAPQLSLGGTGFSAASTVALNGNIISSTYVNPSQLTVNLPASATALPGNLSFTVTTPPPGGGTSAPLSYTVYLAIANNDMVYNPVNGLFYISVPSSAGAPYGNSVVSVDPATGALGVPIPVGSEPNRLAVTSDGNYLWVGLDAASSVRKVNLQTGTAGLQFYLGGNGGIYQNPTTALALAALPGATDSVVVADGIGMGIYDSGTLRGTLVSYQVTALQVDGTRSEIYAASGSSYAVYSYSSTGLTLLGSASNGTYAGYSNPDLQVTGGKTFTDFGTVYDAEAGALLGTFYSSGFNVAQGPAVADTAQGLAFILDSAQQYSYSYTQIQSFNINTFTPSSNAAIPVTVSGTPSRLTRWGSNGLAFRTELGVYSFRSNLVKDLSGTSADLSVKLAANGGTATGTNTTYTATITNGGPSAASDVVLLVQPPSGGEVLSAVPSAGSCSLTGSISCHVGSMANAAKTTVTITVLQTTAGIATLSAQVSASENDPDSSNNSDSAAVTVTGAEYALVPVVSAISPSAIKAGAADTIITVTGANFSAGSTVMLGATSLASTFADSGTLTATVPANQLANMGWSPVTVVNPAPGGGTSQALPLTIYQVLTVALNHIIYEPYSRKIYASVGSGSATVNGNSIAPITPETGTIGTPVYVGSQPTKMAISDDGNILYCLLGGANSVARFNLNSQTTEFTFSPTFTNYGSPTNGFRDVAVQTGSENTIAVDFGYTSGMGLFDIDPVAKTATERGAGTGLYTGTSLHFYDPQTLYLFNSDTWGTLDKYPITSAGFSFNADHTVSTLLHFSSFQLIGKIGFADAGGVADITTTPATQLGYFAPVVSSPGTQKVASDPSLRQAFFLTETSSANGFYGSPDGIVSYNPATFIPNSVMPMGMSAIEGNNSYGGVDLIRWGQDGLAALTSSGHLYLLHGPFVVPQLMSQNSAATLTSTSAITHGTGNQWITLTGSNFVPGVAVTWKGSYRTTTIVDATHVTVAIPASDVATAGTASLVATNPGAAASNTLTITIN